MAENLFLKTLNGHKQPETPVWMMRQAGRYLEEYRKIRAAQTDFISFCLNPEQASTVTLQPITRYGFDADILFSDIFSLEKDVNERKSPEIIFAFGPNIFSSFSI